MTIGDDMGSERDLRGPRPCCRRIRKDNRVGWCLKDDGHEFRGDLECSGELGEDLKHDTFHPARPPWWQGK